MEALNNIFAQNLARFRTEKGIMQKELAERLQVSRATVSCWESGTYSPKLNTLYEICEALNISLADLLGIEKETAEGYTAEELALIDAYRAHPQLQQAVRILLGIE